MNTISVKKGRDANIILAFSALFKVYTLAPGNIISLIKQPKLTTTKMGQNITKARVYDNKRETLLILSV